MEPVLEVYQASVQSVGVNDGIAALVLDADIIVQLVLLTLVFMSVICWGIILMKWMRLFTATRQSARFLDMFWASSNLSSVYEQSGRFRKSPVAEIFKAGYQELDKITKGGKQEEAADNLARSLRRARLIQASDLERFVTFLATTGATAPFIGLFGTVWGILRAFQKLGTAQQATIQVVGPDIAHALIATAVGLIAAIPAVWAFNYFQGRLKVLNVEMENFSGDFLNIVKRHN